MTLTYLAYGSNLHMVRMLKRIPNARLLGTAPIAGLRLAFHKRSPDGSSKCDAYQTADRDDRIWVAAYAIGRRDRAILDEIEGVGTGYQHAWAELKVAGRAMSGYFYQAQSTHIEPDLQPYAWYRQYVIDGARALNLPADYIARIMRVRTQADPDQARARSHAKALASLRDEASA